MISVLCVQPGSNYYQVPELDLWDIKRDAYNFKGTNKVIAHPPCAQWSKLKSLANENKKEKDLAYFCYEKIKENGGIFEHPVGSEFFKKIDLSRGKLYKVFQSDFGFIARKPTLLWFVDCKPLPYPIFKDLKALKPVANLPASQRAKMPLNFIYWIINSINNNE